MLLALMTLRRLIPLFAIPIGLAVAGCGGTEIKVADNDPLYRGAEIFNQRCAGCHSYSVASAEGSANEVNGSEYKDGPSFDERKEQYEDVLYAIQNGGFSSGPMPQNIVTGREARVVACFVATFSGQDAIQEPSPGGVTSTPKSTDCRGELDPK